jgi:hypothetical protein
MAKWLDKYEQGGLVLKKKTKDNYGKKPNVNDVQASVGPDFVGLGYNTKGRDYSPAWGGQFQNGGIIVNDPKDPRLKKYQDSLNLYNKFKYTVPGGKNVPITQEEKRLFKDTETGIAPIYKQIYPGGKKEYFGNYPIPKQPVEYQAPKAEVKKVKGSKKYFINETEVDEAMFNRIVPKKDMAMGGKLQNGDTLPEKVLVHDPQDYEGGHRYALKKTITPYKTNQEIKKYTKAATNPEDIDFLHNYRHTADKTPSNATSTFVPYEGDRHWNIDRFITDPAFGKNYPNLKSDDGSIEAERRNVLADMFKYQMFQHPEQSRGKSFREAKRFVRNEIDPRVNGPYFQNYMREGVYPVGTGGITTFTNNNPFFEAWQDMQGEEDQSNKEYRKNPWDDAKVEEVAKDYLKNTKKLSRKETREQIKKWKDESKSMIDDYYKPSNTPQTGGEPIKEYAMGGGIPGAVGFTYARVAGSAPANGKYTKKTKASAQTGISMNVESGTYQPTVTTATKAEIKKSAENAKKEKYYNPKKPTYKSGNKQIDFLASNPWLMDLPIIGDKIKEQAYALGTQKTGSIRTDEDIADPNKIDELRGKYLAGSTNDFSKPLDLVKQYIYADQKLPNSKFTPKDDYYDFLPSYSLQDKLEAPTNESLNMSNFGKENTSYKKGDEIIWNNDGSYFQGDKYKDLMDVVKTHKPKYYNSEKGNLPYDLFYKSGNLVDLAHYKSGFGYDEDVNLPYASISDAWDFYPGDYQKLWGEDKKGEDSSLNTREYQQAYLMHKVGNPYKIYDRTYIDPENKTLVNDKEILAKKQLKKSIDLIPGLTKEQKQKRYEQAWKLTGKSYNPNMKKGGVIKDDMGQWAHPGEVTEIGSNDITMQGVDYPVLGISDTGDTKMMQPGEDYKFDGEKVTEFPMAQNGKWLKKYSQPLILSDATRNIGFEQSNRAKLDQYYKSIDPANQPSISQWNPKPGEVEAQNAREAERVKEYNNWVSKFSRNPHVIKGTKNLGDAGMFAIDAMTLGEGALALNTIAKPIIKAATKKAVNVATNIATKAGTKAATKASSSNYVKDLYDSGKSYATEIAGEQLAGAENRKAIAEGNKWFEDWANHPETAKKIKQQIIDQKILGKNNPEIFDRIDTPETMQDYRYITTYKPGATEYPLADHTKDLIKTILGNNKYRTPMVHGDNFGVSYRHGMSKWSNMDDYVPGDRFSGPGTWISRTPAMDQAARKSITIHENTHDWLRSDALERLGFKDEIQKHLTKEAIDSKAKFIKSGYNFRENYLGYLAHETEVHARIMETRLHFGLTPTDKVTSEMAESMLQAIREGKTPINKQFADIFSSPKGAAKLFNKLPAIAPVAVGVGAAATTLPKEQKNGGWLNKYK